MTCDIRSGRGYAQRAFRRKIGEALLGHANHSMAGHYASPDVGRLLAQANLIVDRSGTRTLLRIAEGQREGADNNSHRVPQPRQEHLVLHAKSFNRIEEARTSG